MTTTHAPQSAAAAPTAAAAPAASLALAQVQALAAALTELQSAPGQTAAFAQRWRSALPDALAALPPRFTEVLLGLLDRLESSALFADESCSFSHRELLGSLALWVEKATERLR